MSPGVTKLKLFHGLKRAVCGQLHAPKHQIQRIVPIKAVSVLQKCFMGHIGPNLSILKFQFWRPNKHLPPGCAIVTLELGMLKRSLDSHQPRPAKAAVRDAGSLAGRRPHQQARRTGARRLVMETAPLVHELRESV